LHEPIIDRDLWDAVQRQLCDQGSNRRARTGKVMPSPLVGKLFDDAGNGLTPSRALKDGRRYRYYISRGLVTGTSGRSASVSSDSVISGGAQVVRKPLLRGFPRLLAENASNWGLAGCGCSLVRTRLHGQFPVYQGIYREFHRSEACRRRSRPRKPR
jgi:hypothetical protein